MCPSGDGRLHDFAQTTWTLSSSDAVDQNAELVSYSEADW